MFQAAFLFPMLQLPLIQVQVPKSILVAEDLDFESSKLELLQQSRQKGDPPS